MNDRFNIAFDRIFPPNVPDAPSGKGLDKLIASYLDAHGVLSPSELLYVDNDSRAEHYAKITYRLAEALDNDTMANRLRLGNAIIDCARESLEGPAQEWKESV